MFFSVCFYGEAFCNTSFSISNDFMQEEKGQSGRVLRNFLPTAADRAGNRPRSNRGRPTLCGLLRVCLHRLLHRGGRLHALLFERPAGKPVFKTDEFIFMPKAPDQECHNGNLCDSVQYKTNRHNDNLPDVGGTFVLNNSHYNSFFALVKTNVRIIFSKVPILGQRRSFLCQRIMLFYCVFIIPQYMGKVKLRYSICRDSRVTLSWGLRAYALLDRATGPVRFEQRHGN